MKSPLVFAIGVIVALFGLMFFLQGIGVVSGSNMSNTVTWSILGPIVCIVGLVMAWRSRPGRSSRPR